MMRVVSNATPLRYLAEIDALHLLPRLFGQVVIPKAVEYELTHQHAPECIRTFIESPPEWLHIRQIQHADLSLEFLDPGEREAIFLAEEIEVHTVLLDEKMARDISKQRGLQCVGTLRILSDGAQHKLIDLSGAIERLRRTTFRVHPNLLDRVLQGTL